MYRGLKPTTLFSNFNELHQYLRIGLVPKQPFNVYSNKMMVHHTVDNEINVFTPLNNSIRTADELSTKLPVTDLNIATQRGADSILHRYRVFKTKLLFDYAGNDYKNLNNYVAALDYSINTDNIKIEYINVDNCENNNYNDFYFDEKEGFELKKSLIIYVKNMAKEENKNKIIVDVHHNLNTYNSLYLKEGFSITTRNSTRSPQWIEIEYTR